jgi:hypothetical protein
VEIDLIALQLHSVSGHRLDRRHAERLAGPDIKPGPVTRALDLTAFQVTFGQGSSVMGTYIIDGVVGAVYMEQGDGPAFDVNQFLASWWQLRAACYLHRF